MPTQNKNESRRDFLKKSTALAALTIASPVLTKAGENDEKIAALFEQMPLRLEVNGVAHALSVEPREAFIKHDGFQCGYCTPGQIMSAVCCVKEGHANNAEEIREFMSGNICRCGAYPNIVDAIMEVKKGGKTV